MIPETNLEKLQLMNARQMANFLDSIKIDSFQCGAGVKERSDWYGVLFQDWLKEKPEK